MAKVIVHKRKDSKSKGTMVKVKSQKPKSQKGS